MKSNHIWIRSNRIKSNELPKNRVYSCQFLLKNNFKVDIVCNKVAYVVICKLNYFGKRIINLIILCVKEMYLVYLFRSKNKSKGNHSIEKNNAQTLTTLLFWCQTLIFHWWLYIDSKRFPPMRFWLFNWKIVQEGNCDTNRTKSMRIVQLFYLKFMLWFLTYINNEGTFIQNKLIIPPLNFFVPLISTDLKYYCKILIPGMNCASVMSKCLFPLSLSLRGQIGVYITSQSKLILCVFCLK